MSAPTAYEQLILELINRARLDPDAEASRIGISLNQNLSPGQISSDSKQPLAYSSTLNNSASSHSNWMLAVDVFSHTGSGGSDSGDRMAAAGYQFTGSWTWGENIAWNGTTGTLNILQAALGAHDGLFDSAGHRLNILNDNFNEIGIGAETGNFQGYNAFMLTENFAKTGSGSFITGVAYNDSNSDNFYSIGEGRGNVAVSFSENGSGIGSTSTWGAGGYALKTTETGNIAVTFSGGGLPAPVTATIALGTENAKVDLIGTNRIESSVTTTLGQNAIALELLGLNDIDGTGNSLNNTIIGNASNNSLRGGSGNDDLYGRNGNDYFRMGTGNDTVDGGSGRDYISYVDSNAGVIIDLLLGTASGGYAAGDTLTNLESISGSVNFADTLKGTNAGNTLVGYGGNDSLWGRGGNDLVKGGDGNDYFRMGTGNDTVDGGSGRDYISYVDSNAGVIIDLLLGTASGGYAAGDTLTNLESISGSVNFADTLKGTNAGNTLVGYGGNDSLWGRGGNDLVKGGDGNDYFRMGTGNDTVDGGSGRDYISYVDSNAGVIIDLLLGTASGGYAAGDTLTNLESISGSVNFADTLKGTNAGNTLVGYGGNDSLWGRGGNDLVKGGDGNDYFRMGTGNDTVDGGSGRDYISYVDSNAGVIIDLLLGTASGGYAAGDTLTNLESISGSVNFADTLKGTNAGNTLVGYGGNDSLWGRGGNDLVKGGDGNDYFRMGTGNDTVDGGSGRDYISYVDSNAGVIIDLLLGTASGGYAAGDTLTNLESISGSVNFADTLKGTNAGNTLVGYGGNDFLQGRGGDDKLIGGADADKFYFTSDADGIDQILDFETGTDLIQLLSTGFDNQLAPGTISSGDFVAGSNATQNHGQLLYEQSSGELAWDADGTGGQAADVFAELADNTALTFTDFVIV